MSNKIDKLIPDFLEYLKSQGRSLLTIRNYKLYLGRFLEFSRNPLPQEIDLEMISKYQVWLRELPEKKLRLLPLKKGFKKNTLNYHLIALRSFLKYLADKKIETLGPEEIGLLESPKRKMEIFGIREIEKILAMPVKSEAKEIIKLRDKAILEVLFSTGMRVSEMANLKKGDIKGEEILARGRGGKIRKMPLLNQARRSINDYLEMRTDKMLALFVGHDKAARSRKVKELVPQSNLTARSIERIVQKYAKMAGIEKNFTPQVLRNSLAVNLLRDGVDESEVQARLGYESDTTTRRHQELVS